jgi:hypothetical protein
MPRFAQVQGSLVDAINVSADVANFDAQTSFVEIDADDPTLTAAQVLNGIVLVYDQSTSQDVTLPDAVDLIAAIPNAQVGSSFDFVLMNRHNAGGNVGVVDGNGTSGYGGSTIPPGNTQFYKGFITSMDNSYVTMIALLGADQFDVTEEDTP